MNKNIAIGAAFIISLLFFGCGKRNVYHLEAKNNANESITNVSVMINNSEITLGVIAPNAHAFYGFVSARHPLPEKFSITWTTPDGVQHEKTLAVKGQIPESFDEITIYVTIDSDNEVELSWEEDAVAKERLQSGGGVRKL